MKLRILGVTIDIRLTFSDDVSMSGARLQLSHASGQACFFDMTKEIVNTNTFAIVSTPFDSTVSVYYAELRFATLKTATRLKLIDA